MVNGMPRPAAAAWDIFEICQRRVRIDVQEAMADEPDGRRKIQEIHEVSRDPRVRNTGTGMADPATLTTPRLILRALTLADADILFPVFADRDTMRFFGDRHGSVADTRALFRHVIEGAEAHSSCQWTIATRLGRSPDRLTVVGSLSVNGIVGGTAHMGFILMKEHHGRGFATEAVHAVLDHAFGALGLHRFTCASIRRTSRPSGWRRSSASSWKAACGRASRSMAGSATNWCSACSSGNGGPRTLIISGTPGAADSLQVKLSGRNAESPA